MKIIIFLKNNIYRIAIGLNLGVSFLLLLSYLSVYTSPYYFYPLAFLGLIYPFLLILNLLFSIFWISRKSKLFLISLICILVGFNFITRICQITVFENKKTANENKIKIMSYNVRVFDLWHWSDDKQIANKIFGFIKKNKPEILCMQEFYSKEGMGKNARDSILKAGSFKYFNISGNTKGKRVINYGVATFSCFPIVASGKVQTSDNNNYCIFSDLKINDKIVRVYNLHLASLHLGKKDYLLIDKLKGIDSIDIDGYKSIFTKFKRGYKKRSLQVNSIVRHMKNCKYPIILCGDFNDTPMSYAYQQLSSHLYDAFKISGNGIGYTYINKYPTFRIDYILHSKNIISTGFIVPHVNYSDHFPITCELEIN